MIQRLITTIAVALIAISALAAPPPPVLTLHVVQEIQKAPVIDGKLDDACWQTVPKYTTFYSFNVMKPKPTPLKTAFQLAYDPSGVYLAISMFETNMAQLKATITQNGDQSLWEDDSDEIYFDSTAAGIGFRKFIVNALATKCTLYRMDPANIDTAWSPDGWRVATSRDDKAWYIEAFFPWSDLGRVAKDGDLWRFSICRFSWSSGYLASSSIGASYSAPERLGWLFFRKAQNSDMNALAAQLKTRIAGDWLLPVQNQAILKAGDKLTVTTMPGLLNDLKTGAGVRLAECQKLVAADTNATKVCQDLAGQFAGVTPTEDPVLFQQSVQTIGTIEQQLEDLKYAQMLNALIAAQKK